MMRGCLPSITATAELVVPRSIPMTWPLTFSVDSSAYRLTNDEPRGDLVMGEARARAEARGRNWRGC